VPDSITDPVTSYRHWCGAHSGYRPDQHDALIRWAERLVMPPAQLAAHVRAVAAAYWPDEVEELCEAVEAVLGAV
jgi:hypothetical protein